MASVFLRRTIVLTVLPNQAVSVLLLQHSCWSFVPTWSITQGFDNPITIDRSLGRVENHSNGWSSTHRVNFHESSSCANRAFMYALSPRRLLTGITYKISPSPHNIPARESPNCGTMKKLHEFGGVFSPSCRNRGLRSRYVLESLDSQLSQQSGSDPTYHATIWFYPRAFVDGPPMDGTYFSSCQWRPGNRGWYDVSEPAPHGIDTV